MTRRRDALALRGLDPLDEIGRRAVAGAGPQGRAKQRLLPRRVEGRANQRSPHAMVDLHVGVPRDGVALRGVRLVDEQGTKRAQPAACSKLLHELETDDAAAEPRRRLGEDELVLLWVLEVSRDHRGATVGLRRIDQRPVRADDQRGGQIASPHRHAQSIPVQAPRRRSTCRRCRRASSRRTRVAPRRSRCARRRAAIRRIARSRQCSRLQHDRRATRSCRRRRRRRPAARSTPASCMTRHAPALPAGRCGHRRTARRAIALHRDRCGGGRSRSAPRYALQHGRRPVRRRRSRWAWRIDRDAALRHRRSGDRRAARRRSPACRSSRPRRRRSSPR